MIEYVVDEILECRRRAPGYLQTKPFLAVKTVFFISSIIVPYLAPIRIALLYALASLIPLAILRLKRCIVYVSLSGATIYLFMVLVAYVFGGDISYATRGVLVAVSTLSASITFFASTKPSVFKRLWYLYLLMIIFGDVLREVRDVATVYRARGSKGLRHCLEVYIASLILALRRVEALADSLRARGIEVTE